MIYADDRPVTRVSRMTLAKAVWRGAPGFRPRFEGTIQRGGRRIEAYADQRDDGRTWVRDFDIAFVRRW